MAAEVKVPSAVASGAVLGQVKFVSVVQTRPWECLQVLGLFLVFAICCCCQIQTFQAPEKCKKEKQKR